MAPAKSDYGIMRCHSITSAGGCNDAQHQERVSTLREFSNDIHISLANLDKMKLPRGHFFVVFVVVQRPGIM